MEKLIVANYKMNGNINFYQKVAKVINTLVLKDTVVLCPPFVYMPFLNLTNKNVFLGSQDVSNVINTKSTGQISPIMLKEFNIAYSIVGHSERRANGETNTMVASKVEVLQDQNIIPIVCVGEKNKSSKLNVLVQQVKAALKFSKKKNIVFAYEPVWAIGSGEVPTVDKINEAVGIVRKIANKCGFEAKVLYGGSVNTSNYQELISADIDGFLLGGVSNKIEDFVKILKGE